MAQWGRAKVDPAKGKLPETIDKLRGLRKLLEERQAATLAELDDVHELILKQRAEYEAVHADD